MGKKDDGDGESAQGRTITLSLDDPTTSIENLLHGLKALIKQQAPVEQLETVRGLLETAEGIAARGYLVEAHILVLSGVEMLTSASLRIGQLMLRQGAKPQKPKKVKVAKAGPARTISITLTDPRTPMALLQAAQAAKLPAPVEQLETARGLLGQAKGLVDTQIVDAHMLVLSAVETLCSASGRLGQLMLRQNTTEAEPPPPPEDSSSHGPN